MTHGMLKSLVALKSLGALKSLAMISVALGLVGCAYDYDNNPPGPRGGPGTNWENPPGPAGGPGVSPDRRRVVVYGRQVWLTPVAGGYYFHRDFGYWRPDYGWWNQSARCWYDRDGNPPGRRGGRGTNWENPPGFRGGPGTSPDRFGRCR